MFVRVRARACVCVCVCVHVCVYTHTHAQTNPFTYKHHPNVHNSNIPTYTCVYLHTHARTHINTNRGVRRFPDRSDRTNLTVYKKVKGYVSPACAFMCTCVHNVHESHGLCEQVKYLIAHGGRSEPVCCCGSGVLDVNNSQIITARLR